MADFFIKRKNHILGPFSIGVMREHIGARRVLPHDWIANSKGGPFHEVASTSHLFSDSSWEGDLPEIDTAVEEIAANTEAITSSGSRVSITHEYSEKREIFDDSSNVEHEETYHSHSDPKVSSERVYLVCCLVLFATLLFVVIAQTFAPSASVGNATTSLPGETREDKYLRLKNLCGPLMNKIQQRISEIGTSLDIDNERLTDGNRDFALLHCTSFQSGYLRGKRSYAVEWRTELAKLAGIGAVVDLTEDLTEVINPWIDACQNDKELLAWLREIDDIYVMLEAMEKT